MSGQLWYGDCLTVMRDHMKLGSVDLIYLDPPFNSQREYNAIYKDETGRPLPDQIEAFCDLWELDEERERALRTMPVLMRESGIADDAVEFWRLWMNALRNTQPRLLAYLSYMVERLLVMKGLRWSHFVGQFGSAVKVYSGLIMRLLLLSLWGCGQGASLVDRPRRPRPASVEGRMGPLGVVEADPLADDPFGVEAVGELCR